MSDNVKYNRIGEAVSTFISITLDSWDAEQDKNSLPRWLVSCLGLLAVGAPGAIESLLQNLDAEPELPWWVNLELLRLLNDAHNKIDAESSATIAPKEIVKAIVPVERASEHKPTVAVQVNVQNDNRRVTVRQQTDDTSDRTMLGEFRRVIGIVTQPFKKSDVRKIVEEENPQWDHRSLTQGVHNAFAYLYGKSYIEEDPNHDPNTPGEGTWIRSPGFCDKSDAARNTVPVFEPATGNQWPTIKALAKEIGSKEPHRIYRAIAAGEPLDDGRIIKYVNGEGQRKAGQLPVERQVRQPPQTFHADDSGTLEDVCIAASAVGSE